MQTALIDLHYLPSLEYFTCIKKFDKILIEREEHFVKQTYRNRCHILGANKVDRLTIPVIGGNRKVKIKDVKIDYHQKWLNVHRRAIRSAYGKAPFYEFFFDYFDEEFQKREKFLFDLNFRLLTLCLKLLRMEPSITFSEQYIKEPEGDITDLRSVIHPKRDFHLNNLYRPHKYNQVFGAGFVANLSIIDLLFCEGPNSADTLTESMLAK